MSKRYEGYFSIKQSSNQCCRCDHRTPLYCHLCEHGVSQQKYNVKPDTAKEEYTNNEESFTIEDFSLLFIIFIFVTLLIVIALSKCF